jgi:hypothetical protein
MSKVPNPAHPSWCLRGPHCAELPGLHFSEVIGVAQRGTEVIQVGAGLWQMDVGPTSPGGVLLELSVGAEVERWPVDLAQARALVPVLLGLLGRTEAARLRAA